MSEIKQIENNIIELKQKQKEQRKKTQDDDSDYLKKANKAMDEVLDKALSRNESELVILKDSVTQKIDRVMDILSEKDHKVKEAIELDSN